MQKQFLILLLGLPQLLAAQSDSTRTLLGETTVLAQRIQLPFSRENRSIQVLNRAQLEAMPVRSIAEALQSIAGVDVRQRGPLGIQADLHVRGGGFDQVLVLLNGVRMSDPQTGHHLMNIPVDWASVERIEVLKGPGARIYGQNAFACAINIVTKVATEKSLRLGVAAGDFGYKSAQAGVHLPGQRIQQQVALSADASDGYRYNTDFQVLNAFYQGQWQQKRGMLHWLADINTRRFGANGYYGRLSFTDQYEQVQTNLISVSYETAPQKGWRLAPRISWRRSQDVYDFLRYNHTNAVNFHLSQVVNAEMNSTRYWANGQQSGLGGSVEYTFLGSSRLGVRERVTSNFFAEHRFLIGTRLDVVPGISFSHFSDFGAFFYPGVDLGLQLGSGWRTYANAGYNYRIPTFTDLYYEDAGNKGNPNLQPERAFSAEAGLRYRPNQGPVDLQVALFRRDGRKLIDWAKDDPAAKWETRNYNNVLVQGLEVNGNWAWRTCQISLGYTWIDAVIADEVAFSRYALNHLRHQLNLGGTWAAHQRLRLHVRARWCDRIVQLPEVKSDYWVVDGKITCRVQRWSFFTELVNLFNTSYGEVRYSDREILTQPGRWLRAGVQVEMWKR